MAEAVVVGSGPNGLAAAIVLARAGWSVTVREALPQLGGGCRSAELTLPGFVHDLCSAIHPLAAASPFFRSLPLELHGLQWVHPDAPLAHPLDDGPAVLLERSIEATGEGLSDEDASAWAKLFRPLCARWEPLFADALAPLHVPRHPFLLAKFGAGAIQPAETFARAWFRGDRARALFTGMAAHAIAPLDRSPTAAYCLMLAVAGHAVGWPFPRGGAGRITEAMASYLGHLGGRVVTDAPVDSLDELRADAILCDVSPRELLRIGGDRLPARYRRRLERFRYGPGVFKVDWALSEPIPWRDPGVARGGTVHLGGTMEEIVAAEAAPWQGRIAERPHLLLGQHTRFDPTRAPAGKHTAWGYIHVPNGSTEDATERVEAQIERFAPGFRDTILARSTMNARQMEAHNRNLVGGDITGGATLLGQIFFRPVVAWDPYRTPAPGVWLCSASTPPGGAVHGMCGYWAAQSVLRAFGGRPPPDR